MSLKLSLNLKSENAVRNIAKKMLNSVKFDSKMFQSSTSNKKHVRTFPKRMPLKGLIG